MNSPSASPPPWRAHYDALTSGVALVSLERTQIELAGDDRARFMHNLCTNEIKRLPPGAGTEAFITNVQGKTLGHGFIFVTPESIVIDTVSGESEKLLAHLDKYLVSEQVTLTDRTGEWSELLLAGPKAVALLTAVSGSEPPEGRLAHTAAEIAGVPVFVRRVDWTGPGFLISTQRERLAAVTDALHSAGAVQCGREAYDAARIEQGTPLFGRDITDQNLPQEVGRDALAISFVKGCYLGQETVARIDALGHVNKLLVGLRFAGPQVPDPGTELLTDGKPAGRVTSASYSPRLDASLALGYVKRGQETLGTRLTSSAGEAEVVKLPLV